MSAEARYISEQIVVRLKSRLDLITSISLLFQDCSEKGTDFALKVVSPILGLGPIESISGCEIIQGKCNEKNGIKMSYTLFNFKLSTFKMFFYDLKPIFGFLKQNFGNLTRFDPSDPFFLVPINASEATPSRFSLIYEPKRHNISETHMLTLFSIPINEPPKTLLLSTIIGNLNTCVSVTNYIELFITDTGNCKLVVHLNRGKKAPTFSKDVDDLKYDYNNYHNCYAMLFPLYNRRTLFTILNYLLNVKKFKLSTEKVQANNLLFKMENTHYNDD